MRVESRAEEQKDSKQQVGASFPGPQTDADVQVRQARQKTFGADGLRRLLIRQMVYSPQKPAVHDGSLPVNELLWQVRSQKSEPDPEQKYQSEYVLAWDDAALIHSMKMVTPNEPQQWEQIHYFNGGESWIKETSTEKKTYYHYSQTQAFDRGLMPFAFPQLEAAGGRVPWSGPTVRLEEFTVAPELTRYRFVAQERVDGVDCEVFEGPARSERLWIERSTKLVKATSRLYGQEELPNYLSELIVEVAGRRFKSRDEYQEWRDKQSPELQAKLSAHWAEAHWPTSQPGNLSVFSDYKPIAPGIQWPMVCERTVILSKGPKNSDGFNVYHSRIVITEATQDFSMRRTC